MPVAGVPVAAATFAELLLKNMQSVKPGVG
jgi:hypothetical protein